MVLPSIAVAQITPPDSKKVTEINEAAKICGFDEVALKWNRKDATTIQVWVAADEVAALSDPNNAAPKFVRLRDCFFPWAYDRKVQVELNVGNGSS